MSVFISVVSHGHGALIKKLNCLSKLATKFSVVVKINKKEDELVEYLEKNNIIYIDEQYGLGFGHNNNIVYDFCKDKLSMKGDDYFLVYNPDVISDEKSIDRLIQLMQVDNTLIAGVNLFKDESHLISDNSIRRFPTFAQFIKSFLGMKNSAVIDKSSIKNALPVDWAAGSFLAFKASHYALLKGFDEGYFMYCEDIDICYRSKLLGEPVIFYPEIKVLHLAEHANRKMFSKHFYWHVTSVVRFLLSKHMLIKNKSIIN